MMQLTNFDFDTLSRDYGTPFYLYDMDQARAHVRRLRSHLPSSVSIYYAMKANSSPGVLAAMKKEVQGLDVSSSGEIEMALSAGYAPSAMSFAGPGKTERDITRAIELDLHALSIESAIELERADTLSRRMGKRVNATIRINPHDIPKQFAMKMGGAASQFGTSEEDADAVVRAARRAPGIALRGFHVFSGTQCLEVEGIVENLKQTLSLAERLSREHEVVPEIVNLGGGFGIPYFAGQEDMDHDALGAALSTTLRSFVEDHKGFAETQFIFELGRYLIGSFGIYVSRVVDVKQTRGKRFVVLDGGMNHCFAATGYFGQLVKKNYPVRNLSKPADASPEAHELVGPLCTPMDSMARNVTLPRLDIGDLVGIMSVGAYGFSASPLLFLGHDTPPEIIAHGGSFSISRPRRAAHRLLDA